TTSFYENYAQVEASGGYGYAYGTPVDVGTPVYAEGGSPIRNESALLHGAEVVLTPAEQGEVARRAFGPDVSLAATSQFFLSIVGGRSAAHTQEFALGGFRGSFSIWPPAANPEAQLDNVTTSSGAQYFRTASGQLAVVPGPGQPARLIPIGSGLVASPNLPLIPTEQLALLDQAREFARTPIFGGSSIQPVQPGAYTAPDYSQYITAAPNYVTPEAGGINYGQYATSGSYATTGMLPGLTYGSALSAALPLASLGTTVYGALYSQGTTQDILSSAIAGGVTGAAAGRAIGGFFGEEYQGIGTAVGAIAGAAISAGAAAFGKGEHIPTAGERAYAAAREASGPFADAVKAAASLEELAAAFDDSRYYLAGPKDNPVKTIYIGLTGPGGPLYDPSSGVPPAGARVTNPADLAKPAVFKNILVQSIDASGGPNPDQQLTYLARSQAARIAEQAARILVEYTEQLPTPSFLAGTGAATISKSTILPLYRAGEIPAGSQINVFADTLEPLNLTTAQKLSLLRDLMAIDRDHDVGAFRQETLFGASVSVGHLTV
ncbi:MAG TPA: hypothetical protein VFE11_04035, partial [Dongiaceae bacterium]|nr:hypothetical protein [Dongiaceae bacterium]